VTRHRVLRALSVLAITALAAVPLTPAFAEKAEVPTLARSWFWETQKSQAAPNPTGGDAAKAELPNPFCPSTPGLGSAPGEGCREGRLPVEVVGGDYETPDKMSAIAWDFLSVLPGSKVSKFTVTMVEASDPQSQPVNVDGKELQACILEQFFGDGEAREYKEAPKFKCTKSDPTAKRKEVAPKKDGEDPTHEWTFDLTKFAQVWAKGKSKIAGVMIVPAKPEKPGAPDNADWRVVLQGPDDDGVKSKIEFEPPEVETFPTSPPSTGGGSSGGSSDPGIPPATGTDGTDYGTSAPTSTGSTDFGSSAPTTSGGTTDPGATTDPGVSTADPVAPEPGTEQAADVVPEVENLPGYVWLALLGGLIGFSLVKRTVIESATGMRPDGVLAQIRQMNAEKNGTTATAAVSGGGLLSSAGTKVKSVLGNLSLRRKG
jgi:hypothetical protein